MNRYNPPRVHLIWLIVAAILMVAIVFKATEASDHYYRDDDGDVEVGVVTGDNINSGGSHKSLALVNSLGDVDINDCVISKQLSFSHFGYWLCCIWSHTSTLLKFDFHDADFTLVIIVMGEHLLDVRS